MQLVAELVGLRAQGVGDRQVGAQLALQRDQLGAVAHRGDGADPLAVAGGGAPVEDDHPGADQRHGVLRLAPAPEAPPVSRSTTCGSRPSSSTSRPTGSATRPRVEPRGVVHHRHPAVGADRDHALADAVQERLAVVGEHRDLGRRQSARAPLDHARDDVGAETAEQCPEAEEEHQVAGGTGQPVHDRRVGLLGERRGRSGCRRRPGSARGRRRPAPRRPRRRRSSRALARRRCRRARARRPDQAGVGGREDDARPARRCETSVAPERLSARSTGGASVRRVASASVDAPPRPGRSWSRTTPWLATYSATELICAPRSVGEGGRRLAHRDQGHDAEEQHDHHELEGEELPGQRQLAAAQPAQRARGARTR